MMAHFIRLHIPGSADRDYLLALDAIYLVERLDNSTGCEITTRRGEKIKVSDLYDQIVRALGEEVVG